MTRPDDQILTRQLKQYYHLDAFGMHFLPVGADADTLVYCAELSDGTAYFLKLRRYDFLEASVTVPHLLSERRFPFVIPPLPNTAGQLWTAVDPFKMMVYPFIQGENGFERPLSAGQRMDLGKALRRLHAFSLPQGVVKNIPRETLSQEFRRQAENLPEKIGHSTSKDPIVSELAVFMATIRNEIKYLVEKTDRFTELLKARPLPVVLCHGDIHGWNMLLDDQDRLFIVDWDTLILAPKERDLMFVGCGLGGRGQSPSEEVDLFYRGYGKVKPDPVALAYYRYERIIQDIVAFCDVILDENRVHEARRWALDTLISIFKPKGFFETARQLEMH